MNPDPESEDGLKWRNSVNWIQVSEGSYGIIYLNRVFGVIIKKLIDYRQSNTGSEFRSQIIEDRPENGFMKHEINKENFDREYRLLKGVSHPHIIKVYDHWSIDDLPVFSMEYAFYGDLLDYRNSTGKISDSCHKTISSQLLSALAYLHGHNIAHLDIKLDNLLISSLEPFIIKLGDFGFARSFDKDKCQLYTQGSYAYYSPEIAYRQRVVGPEIDIWSLGISLYTLAFGRFPCAEDPGKKDFAFLQIQSIQSRGLPIPVNTSPILVKFLLSMIQINPSIRSTAKNLLKDPWLIDNEVNLPSLKRIRTPLSPIGSAEIQISLSTANIEADSKLTNQPLELKVEP